MRGFYEQGQLPKLETDPKKIQKAYPKLRIEQVAAHNAAIQKALGPSSEKRAAAKKARSRTLAEDIRRRALARQKAEDPRNWAKSPTDIDENKVLAGLRDAVEKQAVGEKMKDLKKKVAAKKFQKLLDKAIKELNALSKKRSHK